MNNENLTMAGKARGLTSEEAQKMGRKGGLSRSINKKVASRVRELKKKGLTNDDAKVLLNIFEDAGYSAFDIGMRLLDLRSKDNSLQEKLAIERALMEWQKMHHGDKLKIESQNLNLNLNHIEFIERNPPDDINNRLDTQQETKTSSSSIKRQDND